MWPDWVFVVIIRPLCIIFHIFLLNIYYAFIKTGIPNKKELFLHISQLANVKILKILNSNWFIPPFVSAIRPFSYPHHSLQNETGIGKNVWYNYYYSNYWQLMTLIKALKNISLKCIVTNWSQENWDTWKGKGSTVSFLVQKA